MMKVWCAGPKPVERGLKLPFGAGIKRRRRLVEDHDRWILEQGAGDGDALALAAGKRTAAFADHRRKPFRLARDEIHRLRRLDGRHHLGLARLRSSDPDILLDAAGEQHRLLKDNADIAPQAVECDRQAPSRQL